MPRKALSDRVKACAREAGFDEVRISGPKGAALQHFKSWIAQGYAGVMNYLQDQQDRRSDLVAAFPWAKSVVVCALQYDTPHPYSTQASAGSGWISRYAWGDDYHVVLRKRLEVLRQALTESFAPFESRAYVDTGPIAEKAYAVASGLGSYGKNTCVLNQRLGSWFFIGVLVTDIELEADSAVTDICGTCRACLDACPTQAFPAPYVLDARRCVSYLTIEVKETVDSELRALMGAQVFGCDICQDVCPWNSKRRVSGGEWFEPRETNVAPSFDELATLSQEDFLSRFRGSPVKRTKRRGLLRNVAIAIGNTGSREQGHLLDTLATDEDPIVREHALWARDRWRERHSMTAASEVRL